MKQLFGLLLVVGLIFTYWKLLVAAAVLGLVVYVVMAGWQELRAEAVFQRSRRDELIARCDQQHAWVMAGDPRGTFG